MTETIKDRLNQLIAEIDEMRASLARRKAALLQDSPTEAAMRELVSLNSNLEGLRLAEDMLSDAVTAIEKRASSACATTRPAQAR